VLAWLIPGGGHLLQKRRDKGLVFLIAIPLMFGIGLWLSGRLFPLEWTDPLVFLGAIADRGVGLPYVLARMMDAGAGTVTDASAIWQHVPDDRRTLELSRHPRCVRHRDGPQAAWRGERACRGERRGEAPRQEMTRRGSANERERVSHASGAGIAGVPASERAGGSGGAKPRARNDPPRLGEDGVSR
jgi:hypothetical protein